MEGGCSLVRRRKRPIRCKTHECKDSTIIQAADDCAISLTNIIRHHETEYLTSLQAADDCAISLTNIIRHHETEYLLFRIFGGNYQLLVHYFHGIKVKTAQFALTKDINKELGIGK